MRILIVEDEITTRLILLDYLAQMGACDTANNGEEAVKRFRQALAEKKPYDLVCLDIVMPGMDGHATLKQIRAEEEAAGIMLGDGAKVIMITVMHDPKNIMGAFKETAEAYLTKPFTQEELIKTMKRLGLPAS